MSGWHKKRHWKAVTFYEGEKGWGVKLDQTGLVTPGKRQVILPTRKIAELVAQEWEAQEEIVAPDSMPYSRMANTAIDKISYKYQEVIKEIASYSEADLLCYRAEKDKQLYSEQAALWDPVLQWAEQGFDLKLTVYQGLMPGPQPEKVLRQAQKHLGAYGVFSLAALHDIVSLSGSFVLGFAAVCQAWSLDEIWQMACLDEEYQNRLWGVDEIAKKANEEKFHAFTLAANFFNAAAGA